MVRPCISTDTFCVNLIVHYIAKIAKQPSTEDGTTMSTNQRKRVSRTPVLTSLHQLIQICCTTVIEYPRLSYLFLPIGAALAKQNCRAAKNKKLTKTIIKWTTRCTIGCSKLFHLSHQNCFQWTMGNSFRSSLLKMESSTVKRANTDRYPSG
jgi:hypothetical protein